MEDAEHQYVIGQGRNDFPELLAAFQAAGDREAGRADALIDHSYGPHDRQRLDFFPAAGVAHANLLYFHAGYWQSRDKANFRFIAGPLSSAGLNVALANYPLCPDVTVAELVDRAEDSLHAIARLAPGLPLILSGHSAGGHLAVELAMRGRSNCPEVCGVVAISGVFDLRPLVGTSLNRNLRLDAAQAERMSPVLRARLAAPAVFAVGGSETDAFVQQNAAMAHAWRRAGNEAEELIVPGAHHFSVLSALIEPGTALNARSLGLATR